MMFDVLAWVLLLAVTYNIGSGALALAGVRPLRPGDRVVLAAWLGVVVLSAVLLGLSVITPLSPAVGIGAAAVLVAGSRLLARSARGREPRSDSDEVPLSRAALAIGIAIIVIGAAAVASDPVTLYDALVYHVGIVRWLRDHGTVPGVALIHNRLGHVSSWFALAAPFEPATGPSTAANVPLGLALVLVGAQGAIAAARIVVRRASPADWVLGLSSIALIWPVIVTNAATPSPDVAANVLIVITAWAMCAIADGASAPAAGVASESRDGSPDAWLSPRLIPFVLAVGACTVKLFAAPAVLGAGAYYVVRRGRDARLRVVWSRVLACVFVGLLLAAPFLVANLVATGCLLFPVPASCVDTPWALGTARVVDYAEYIRDVARWETRRAVSGASPLGWVMPWIGAHPVVTVLIVCAPVLALVGARWARRMPAAALPVAMATSLLGIATAAWQAPAPRFLYAYVILPPVFTLAALLGARGSVRGSPDLAVSRPTGMLLPEAQLLGAVGFVVFSGLAAGAYAVVSQKVNVVSAVRRGSSPVRARLGQLLAPVPPAVPARLYRWRVNDVEVLTPVPRPVADTLGYRSDIDAGLGFEKCSTAPLPCTPYLPTRDVHLRAPSRGVAAGFIRHGAAEGLFAGAPRCVGAMVAPFARSTIRPLGFSRGVDSSSACGGAPPRD